MSGLVIISASITMLLMSACSFGQKLSYDPRVIESRSLAFVEHHMADGGPGPQEGDMTLASDAESLKKVLLLKEELRKEISKDGIKKVWFHPENISVRENGPHLDVIIHTSEQVKANGEVDIELRGNYYRLLLVQEGMEWKVQKAISSTPSCMLLFPDWVVEDPDAIMAFDFEDYDAMVAEAEKEVEEKYGIRIV